MVRARAFIFGPLIVLMSKLNLNHQPVQKTTTRLRCGISLKILWRGIKGLARRQGKIFIKNEMTFYVQTTSCISAFLCKLNLPPQKAIFQNVTLDTQLSFHLGPSHEPIEENDGNKS